MKYFYKLQNKLSLLWKNSIDVIIKSEMLLLYIDSSSPNNTGNIHIIIGSHCQLDLTQLIGGYSNAW